MPNMPQLKEDLSDGVLKMATHNLNAEVTHPSARWGEGGML